MMNGLQAVDSWNSCESPYRRYLQYAYLTTPDFNNPNSTILGLMSSLYSLGSIASLPFVPLVADRFGRRMSIIVGSIIMIIGAILQMAAQDCALFLRLLFLSCVS